MLVLARGTGDCAASGQVPSGSSAKLRVARATRRALCAPVCVSRAIHLARRAAQNGVLGLRLGRRRRWREYGGGAWYALLDLKPRVLDLRKISRSFRVPDETGSYDSGWLLFQPAPA